MTDKRVVLEHASGLRQILGCVSELQQKFRQPGLPAFVPDVDYVTHRAPAELMGERDHYVHYREVALLSTLLADDDGA